MEGDARSERETIVIGVGMQKGGVGKTTNTLHLAVALAERNRRVLVWDVDENYGASKVFGIPLDGFWTTMSVLAEDCRAEDAILAANDPELDVELPKGVDFIPSSRQLKGIAETLARQDQFYNPNDCLRPHIDQLRALRRYDYIILDTGPHASHTTRGAYMVSDYFILSLIPEKQAMASLPDALADIANARRPDRNPKLHLLGLIVSRMDRRVVLAKRYEEAIEQQFRDANEQPVKFKTTIGSAAAIDRAHQRAATLLQTEPTHKVSEQYRDLANEVELRISEHRARTAAPAFSREVVNA